MWPIKEKDNRHLFIKWPNLVPYSKLQEYVVTVLLLTSIPLVHRCVQGGHFQNLVLTKDVMLHEWSKFQGNKIISNNKNEAYLPLLHKLIENLLTNLLAKNQFSYRMMLKWYVQKGIDNEFIWRFNIER